MTENVRTFSTILLVIVIQALKGNFAKGISTNVRRVHVETVERVSMESLTTNVCVQANGAVCFSYEIHFTHNDEIQCWKLSMSLDRNIDYLQYRLSS